MTIQADEIRELLAVAREILREHRRMALYSEMYLAARQWNAATPFCGECARESLRQFDMEFKEST